MKRNRPLPLPAWLPTLGLLAWFVLSAGAVLAQGTIVFEAAVSRSEVGVGERFQVTFTLRNAEGKTFRPPTFQNFKQTGPLETLRGTTIVNGRVTMHQSWAYELEAVKAGTFSIGAATVVADGKTWRTNLLNVKVGSTPSVTVPRGAGEDLFITAEFLPSGEVYVGQQVKWQIKVYTRVNVDAADLLELPKFDGFYTSEMKRFDTRVQHQTLRGKQYAVRTLHEVALFPQEAGTFTIGPARLRFEVQQAGAPTSVFGRGTTPVLLQTTPVRLKVKPLPEPAPPGFAGVVGQYEARFSTDRDSLTTDDAFTLVVEIEGNGDARRFVPPTLSLPAGLETFAPKVREEEEFETTEKIMHRQVLEYVILPKQPGEYTLTPSLVYFEPDSNRYLSRQPDQAFVLRVGPGQQAGGQLPADSIAVAPLRPHLPGGRLRDWLDSPWFWLFLTVPITLLLLVVAFRRRRPGPVVMPAVAVAVPAPTYPPPTATDPRTAHEYFTNARRLLVNDSPRLFYDELLKALQRWLSARLGLAPHLLTLETVRARLADRRVPEERLALLQQVWRTCEQAIFAGQHPHLNMDTTWRQTEELVQGLENDLRRG